MIIYQVTISTLDSLNQFIYKATTLSNLKKGKKILLVNPNTKQVKKVNIEYIRKKREKF